MIGQLVGARYRVVRLLGQGGMGAVYEAIHEGTGRRVALKVILGGSFAEAMHVARFHREAKAAGQIVTPHVVQVLDSGTDEPGGFAYLAMELLSGEDLDHVVVRLGALPLDVALRIVGQACVGLVRAHEVGVVHRDLKPANLFLATGEAGEIVVKILDFGIAKVKMDHLGEDGQKGLTKTGSLLGSPAYMSPEQAQGLKTIDHRTDVWSMGVVLYETLAGKAPLHGVTSIAELLVELCVKPPRPIREVAPWVPPEIAAIVHRCLMRDPADRFQTAAELLDAIRRFVPGGFGLRTSMLVSGPTTPGEASPLSRPIASGPQGTVVMSPGPRAAPGGTEGPASAASSSSVSSTDARGAMTSSGASVPVRSSAVAPIGAVLAIVALGGAAWVGFGLIRPGSGPPTPEQASTSARTVSEAPARSTPPIPSAMATAPTAAPSASGSASASAVLGPKRTVRLVVLPSTATVDVDGARVPSRDGVVDLTGPVGSTRRVRVRAGAREVTADVIISADGAVPPAIDLGS